MRGLAGLRSARRPRIPAALVALALAGLPACAHVEPPSGGPEDELPPMLVVSRPDSQAVVPGWSGPVVLAFDERLSERGIDQAVDVTPRTSAVVVDHSGNELRIRLREGWREGTIYHVRILPELRDLFGNSLSDPIRLVFSTGPEIPETRVAGEVVTRTTGAPAPGLRVEAVRTADSLVYATAADTAGRFAIGHVPTGEYLLRAFEDINRNRALDSFEPRDTTLVSVVEGDLDVVRLAVVLPDSTPAAIVSVAVRERTLEVAFDDFLDPVQDLGPDDVVVRDPAGGRIPVSRVAIGRFTEPDDTTAAAPRPSQTLLVELAEGVELAGGEGYAVTVRELRNVVGLAADAESTFTVPETAGEGAGQGPGASARTDRRT